MVFRYERLTSAIFFPQRRSISPRDTTVFRPHNLRHIELHASFLPELSRKSVSLSQDREIKPIKSEMENQESRILKFYRYFSLAPRNLQLNMIVTAFLLETRYIMLVKIDSRFETCLQATRSASSRIV